MEELAVVDEVTAWMAVNSEGIHGSRPWKKFGEGAPDQPADQKSKMFNENARRALDATDIRFTTKGDALYAYVMGTPAFRTLIRSLATDTALKVGRVTQVELLGHDVKLTWTRTAPGSRSTSRTGFPRATRCACASGAPPDARRTPPPGRPRPDVRGISGQQGPGPR